MGQENRWLGTAGTQGCRFGCLYCFTQDAEYKRCPILDQDRPRSLISGSKPFDVIQPACDTELFFLKNWRDYLDNLASTGKIISFATKATVSSEDVSFLKRINEILLSRGSVLHICVTIVKLREWRDLEPRAPSPSERIKFLRRLWEEGIGTCVTVRPLIPFMKEDELQELVSQTYRFTYGYLSGPLYLTDKMRNYMDSHGIDYNIEAKHANWQTDEPEKQVVRAPLLENQLAVFARTAGRVLFENNEDAALAVRKQRALPPAQTPSWESEIRRERVATLYIYDPSTREFMLMFHRNLAAWLAPGGHMELNETPVQAALREAYEEVGVRPQVLKNMHGDLRTDGLQFRRVSVPDKPEPEVFCIIEEFIRPIGGHDPHIHVDHIIVGVADSKAVSSKKDASEVTAYEWFSLEQIRSGIETFDNVPLICEAILYKMDHPPKTMQSI